MRRRPRYRICPQPQRRGLVLGMLGVAAVGLLLRAVYLQVFHADFLLEQGDDRHTRVIEVPASRGMILDRNGEPLAVSTPVDSVWANPRVLLAAGVDLAPLAAQLELPLAELSQRLEARRTRGFIYLRRHMEPDAAARVTALGLPGIGLQREYRRYYPSGEVVGQLLGYTDIDDQGQEGVELQYNDVLRGSAGANRVVRDRLGRTVSAIESVRPAVPGADLTLSIDRRIQYLAYRALKAAVIEHQAEAATAVVLDVTTGEILAMVNQPAGNPNDRSILAGGTLRNRALTDLFEPGSTVKPFTAVAALESGRYRPDTIVDANPGTLKVGRNVVRDVRNFGRLDLSRVIVKSSNVGTVKVALDLPPERLWELYTGAGFGASTGVHLPGEQTGVMPHHRGWGQFEYATHSFGYGLSVTALQLARAYQVLASDGLVRPATVLRADAPGPASRLYSARSGAAVRGMMEGVVSREGTALQAAVAGYRVAGKTGTVRKIVGGRYSDGHYLALFAGFAPVSNPRLAMVVMVDDPRGGVYYGGQVAAPVFSKVIAGALQVLNVAPDDLPGFGLPAGTTTAGLR